MEHRISPVPGGVGVRGRVGEDYMSGEGRKGDGEVKMSWGE